MEERRNGYFIKDDKIKILFTKRTVDAKNAEDVKNICRDYDFNYESLVFNTQVHGADVRLIKSSGDVANNLVEADGLVTSLRKIPLLIFTADCVPLVFYDKTKGVVALAHAGWRGTYNNIAKEILEILTKEYDCQKDNIKVIIGPSVSGENYEVSYDLVEKFAVHDIENYYAKREDSYYLDLWQVNRGLLLKEGVLEKNIELTNFCTVRDNDKFFSYRLDKQTPQRIGTFIEIE